MTIWFKEFDLSYKVWVLNLRNVENCTYAIIQSAYSKCFLSTYSYDFEPFEGCVYSVCLNINWCYGWSRIFWSYINPNPLLICSERVAKLEVSTSSFCKSGDCLFSHQEKYISWKLYIFLFINIIIKSIEIWTLANIAWEPTLYETTENSLT